MESELMSRTKQKQSQPRGNGVTDSPPSEPTVPPLLLPKIAFPEMSARATPRGSPGSSTHPDQGTSGLPCLAESVSSVPTPSQAAEKELLLEGDISDGETGDSGEGGRGEKMIGEGQEGDKENCPLHEESCSLMKM